MIVSEHSPDVSFAARVSQSLSQRDTMDLLAYTTRVFTISCTQVGLASSLAQVFARVAQFEATGP